METTYREWFDIIHKDLENVRQMGWLKEYEKAYQQELIAEACKIKPKAKVKNKNTTWAWKILGEKQAGKIQERWSKRSNERLVNRRLTIKRLETYLWEIAEHIKVKSGDVKVLFGRRSSSTYNSQGFGAISYAKGAAESLADTPRHNDIPVEIEQENRKPSRSFGYSSISHANFKIWVFVASDQDGRILHYKAGPSFREWIRMCWKRGTNPRVYNPWLPHGIEEKLGIDYQGNDLRATS